MEANSPRLDKTKHRMALVQGESFRCVAVERTPGRWAKADDGKDLPRVLEVLKEMGQCDASVFGAPKKK